MFKGHKFEVALVFNLIFRRNFNFRLGVKKKETNKNRIWVLPQFYTPPTCKLGSKLKLKDAPHHTHMG